MDIFTATQNNIWNFKQNHPELIIKDLKKYGISEEIQNIVRQSLLVRGVNKWLKVRRDLIAYKKLIKHRIVMLQSKIKIQKIDLKCKYCSIKDILNNNKELNEYYDYLKIERDYLLSRQELKIYTQIRCDLKKLCMTDRWQIWKDKKIKDMNTINANDLFENI